MAFRSLNHWRTMMNRLRGYPSYATSTTPTMKAYHAPAADFVYHLDTQPRFKAGEFVPVYVAIGMICLSVGLGLQTGIRQLTGGPNVFVKKSRRETIPEVLEPEHVIEEAEKFINKSFFRKVAHVQDFDRQEIMSDPIHGDAYGSERRTIRAVTLKDVGVDPKPN